MPRCSGVTRAGERCQRKWRTADPGLSRRPWYCEQHQAQRNGTWSSDVYTTTAGLKFMITSELVRGEGRFYWAQQYDEQTGVWKGGLGFDGSFDKRQIRSRIEHHAIGANLKTPGATFARRGG